MGMTVLMKKIVNVAPNVSKAKEIMGSLIHEDEADETVAKQIKEKKVELKQYIPDGYEQNYTMAYRKCQEKPGGEYCIAVGWSPYTPVQTSIYSCITNFVPFFQ